jgi:hypothetical protein
VAQNRDHWQVFASCVELDIGIDAEYLLVVQVRKLVWSSVCGIINRIFEAEFRPPPVIWGISEKVTKILLY